MKPKSRSGENVFANIVRGRTSGSLSALAMLAMPQHAVASQGPAQMTQGQIVSQTGETQLGDYQDPTLLRYNRLKYREIETSEHNLGIEYSLGAGGMYDFGGGGGSSFMRPPTKHLSNLVITSYGSESEPSQFESEALRREHKALRSQHEALRIEHGRVGRTAETLAKELAEARQENAAIAELVSERYPTRILMLVCWTSAMAFLGSLMAALEYDVVVIHPVLAGIGLAIASGFGLLATWKMRVERRFQA